TPFNYVDPEEGLNEQLDADLLAEKLRAAANTQTPSFGQDDLSDEEFPETESERVRRLEFERRRKAHYNEFEAVRLARKLIQEELGDEDEDEDDGDVESQSVSTISKTKSEPVGSESTRNTRQVSSSEVCSITDDCADNANTCSCKPKATGKPMEIDQPE
ncbi:protein phosphatase inhibitor 2-like, partial [Teleopsis dalmanni]